MADIWWQPWFAWAAAIAIGLPVLLLVLTEVHAALLRRGNAAAKPVLFVRNFVLPVGAILALLGLASDAQPETDITWVKIVATVFGFLVILALLSGVNVVLFSNARAGTWRDRLPSIFIDLGRLLLIVVGLAVLFSWVWSADVGGLFAALGVTSIVIGLALQNAVGSVISGLLLLFEQPFRLGDWLDTGSVRGRVVEVNWRAVHIDMGNGIQIVPNAGLADSSFRNLSRTPSGYATTIAVQFATDDAPHEVIELLRSVAAGLPQVPEGRVPSACLAGGASYSVTVPLRSPADEDDAIALLLAWLWYAARRRGLHLDNDLTDDFPTSERRAEGLALIGPSLRLEQADIERLTDTVVIERYMAGETVQRAGETSTGLRFVVSGLLAMSLPATEGARLPVGTVAVGGYVGQAALTRERSADTAIAQVPTVVLLIPTVHVDALVRQRPAVAREFGKASDARNAELRQALEAGRQ